MYQPNFIITQNLLTYISKIEAAKEVIDNAALVPAWEAKFRDDARIRTVHYGTKIEGNDLTQEQAEQVIRQVGSNPQDVAEKAGIVARERDIQEVINYRNVLNWIDQWESFTSKPFTLSEDVLKTLHQITVQRIIEEQYVGIYRDKQVIVRSAVDGAVAFRPPIAAEIPYLIEDFFTWFNSPQAQQMHPIFRAAITHYRLVYIHPFIEGNGRTARAMATLVLYSSGYDFKKFFSIEKYFDDDVERYYAALLSVQQQSNQDMTYWLEYFCYGLAIEIDKVKQQVLKLSKDLKLKRQLGDQVALSERQIVLLELLQNQGQISSQDAQKVLPNVSVDTILRDIKDLLQKGVVEKEGVTKGVTYRLKE
ncbi:Dot/Icm type IV secretion system effector CoxFIC1 [soil metagenome]